MRKSELQQKQRRKSNKLSQKIDPAKLELAEARAAAKRMHEIHDRLLADGKLFRIRIPNGVMVATLPVIETYIQQHKLTNITPEPLS